MADLAYCSEHGVVSELVFVCGHCLDSKPTTLYPPCRGEHLVIK